MMTDVRCRRRRRLWVTTSIPDASFTKSRTTTTVGLVLLTLLLVRGLNSATCRHYLLKIWHSHVENNNPSTADVAYVEVVTRTATTLLLGGILWILNSGGKTTANDTSESSSSLAVVTIYPSLGVQLSKEMTSARGQQQQRQNRLFLPRDTIVDCIVYEVILSHMVKNVVAFRIRPPGTARVTSKGDTNNKSLLQKELELIPAFPETEMTYQECLYMRREILLALCLTESSK